MKKIYLLALSVLTILLSCNTRNKIDKLTSEDDVKSLTVASLKGTATKYSQFIDRIRYIPLETPSNALLGGRIPKVIYTKGRYFIFDENKVVVFDSQGKYNFNVGKKGRGPREMLTPSDFIVDTISNTIEILSRIDGKIIRYNLYNGQFINAIRISGISTDKLCKPDTDNYIIYGKGINSLEDKVRMVDNLFFYNKSNNSIIKSTLAIPYYLTRFAGASDNSFSNVKDGILFLRLLDNNIYLIDSTDQVRVKYKIDYGDYNIPMDEKFFVKYKNLGSIIRNTDYAVHFTGLFANDSYLYFLFFVHNENYIVIYDRIHDIILYGNQYKGIKNDIDLGPVMDPHGISGNCFISTIEPVYFIKHFNKIKKDMGEEKWNKFLSNHRDIKKILDVVEPENNPIIALYYLKNTFRDESDKN